MFRIAIITLTALLAIFTSCSDDSNAKTAESLYKQGRKLYDAGEYVEAMNIFMESRDAAGVEKNDTTMMKALLAMGNIHTVFDDYEQAVRMYSTCYTKALETNNDNMRRNSANNMLICHSLLGNGKEALACYRQLQKSPSRGKQQDALFSYVNQGLVAQAQKNMKMAGHYFKCALNHAINHDMGDALECSLYGMLGKTEYEVGDYVLAEEHYLASLKIAQKGGASTVLCSIYEKLAELYRTIGNESKELYFHHLNVELTDSVFNRQRLYNKQGEIIDKERRKTDEEMLSLNNLISQQWWIIGVIGSMLICLVVFIIITYRQNRSLISAQRLLVSKYREHLRHEQMEKELRDEYLSVLNQEVSGVSDGAEASGVSEVTEVARDESGRPDPMTLLLSTQQIESLLAAINRVMENIEIISNPDFSLQQLAQIVQSNTKYVSWVINNTYNKNFKTFINDYRIEEASKMLVNRDDYGHLTLQAIAQKVGFKSTTSFNTAFKRVIGMTPSAYQRLYSEE